MFDRSIKFKIYHEWWNGYLVTEEELAEVTEQEENDNRALTDPDKRILYVVEGHVDRETIAHELLHIFVKYFYVNSAELDVEQFEEVVAEFMGDNADHFIRKRNSILKQFKKLEDKYRR